MPIAHSSTHDEPRTGRGAHDLVCFSHLRWDFVFQRPQHLLSRSAKERRVFFVEEPIFGAASPHMAVHLSAEGVHVAVPHLPHGLSETDVVAQQRALVDGLFRDRDVADYITWYYTPMALKFTRHLDPDVCVYDCMDQLSHFKGAPRDISVLEQELFTRADVVFTGGQSLYEAKRDAHPNTHAFPSAVDVSHFRKARAAHATPADQAGIPNPRIGFIGVIDERFDIDLIGAVAQARPDWHFVMVGPVVKIDPATLPRAANIHYLGGKSYDELPAYLAGWDAAMLPFARNDATRYISPTKTPEYLAAGRRVISTSIRDVVRPYGEQGLAAIADEPESFVAALDSLLADGPHASWLAQADDFLANVSWDVTHRKMWALVDEALANNLAAEADMESLAEGLYAERAPVNPVLVARGASSNRVATIATR